jgi:hypothetical protein
MLRIQACITMPGYPGFLIFLEYAVIFPFVLAVSLAWNTVPPETMMAQSPTSLMSLS